MFGVLRFLGTICLDFLKKVKLLKKPLRKLLKKKGDLSEKVNQCRVDLDKAQADLDNDPFNVNLRKVEAACLQALNNAYKEEETSLKQRAKVNWLKDGDRNSKYFHKMVKGKMNRARIETIMNNDEEWLSKDRVPEEFVNYFKNFLGVAQDCSVIDDPDSLFSKKLDLVHAQEMIRVVTNEEIKAALFEIEDDKAPGPDGYSSKFFKAMWSIVGNDFCLAVHEFFSSGKLLKEFNATVIALVRLILQVK